MLIQASNEARLGFLSKPWSASDLDAFAFIVRSSTTVWLSNDHLQKIEDAIRNPNRMRTASFSCMQKFGALAKGDRQPSQPPLERSYGPKTLPTSACQAASLSRCAHFRAFNLLSYPQEPGAFATGSFVEIPSIGWSEEWY
jgi:hypothetical protein